VATGRFVCQKFRRTGNNFALELPIRSARKFPAAAQALCGIGVFSTGPFVGTDYSLGRAALLRFSRSGNPAR